MILRRDVVEVGFAVVMVVIWIAMGITASLPWTWYLCVPALLWTAAFMVIARRRHPQKPNDPGETLLWNLKNSLAQVEHQIWLLRNVFWWYLLPFCISLGAFFIQVSWKMTGSAWGAVLASGAPGAFVYFLFRWINRLNQAAVVQQLTPRRDNILTVIEHLEGRRDGEVGADLAPTDGFIEAVSELSKSNKQWACWADNWNRIAPSWFEVLAILIPTLLGAYVGWRFALPEFGPVFFQSVVAAVIPFEIAFFGRWYLVSRRYRGRRLSSDGPSRPNAPAIVVIALIVLLSCLAVAAIVVFFFDSQFERNQGAESVRTFHIGSILTGTSQGAKRMKKHEQNTAHTEILNR